MEQLADIEADQSLDPMEVERMVDQILMTQPRSVLDQLELPPIYSQLPFDAKWQIKDVLFDKDMPYRQKHETIFNVIMSLPQNQKRFPSTKSRDSMLRNRRIRDHSRLFESYNALQFTVSFTFKLKELREVLSFEDSSAIHAALSNDELDLNKKLAEVERVMSNLSFDTLDQLFLVGMPIVDADVRERFRRLWYDRPYWGREFGSDNTMNRVSTVTTTTPTTTPSNFAKETSENIPDGHYKFGLPIDKNGEDQIDEGDSKKWLGRLCVDCIAAGGIGQSAREAAQAISPPWPGHIPSLIPGGSGAGQRPLAKTSGESSFGDKFARFVKSPQITDTVAIGEGEAPVGLVPVEPEEVIKENNEMEEENIDILESQEIPQSNIDSSGDKGNSDYAKVQSGAESGSEELSEKQLERKRTSLDRSTININEEEIKERKYPPKYGRIRAEEIHELIRLLRHEFDKAASSGT
ncbi:hypothetical protein Ddc_05687 [Ditylenchus destructor]|nr:hypothetical protein Ddc_05687 [Ditylenchus destructor]